MATIKLSGAVVVGGSGGGSYTLPTASTTVLGGVKIDGTSITIADGVISSTGGSANTGNIVFDQNTIQCNDSSSAYIDFNESGLGKLQMGTDWAADVTIVVDASNTNKLWTFGTDGSVTLPTTELGDGWNEQTQIKSQRKIIPSYRWSASISDTTPTVAYTATNASIVSLKNTMMIQHGGAGFEIFDVIATKTGSDVYYSVTNRVKPPAITDTTVLVDQDGSNVLRITLTLTSGVATAWVTYDATEFGLPND